jgi:putative membrane protein
MLIGVRLQVTNIGLFYLFSIVSSIAFFSLVLFLGAAFGNIGKTIAGVLLLIQFGGSSGIFPVALTPTFFQVMHAYLPMTYSINGLREIIAIGTDPIYLTEQFMVLSGLVVGSALLAWLTFWFLMKKHRTTFVEEEISIK